ncbi:pirin family protein [Candidatus Thalassolituus haligoni]|jgi:redox-sensitive bicupin YhaK (pirin superfamily)|uniref:pirin family protein n=1 Tax=Candidatus Thalassolituus haligoni TaxID=3100113 RepID=UPI0035161616|tara:strand:+ start:624 stop:1340 length:717 start_codon:yes stop_codon:yes gene_type:complete
MIYFRPSQQRGHVNIGWLNSFHSFSFGHYHAPEHMGWGLLRVINDDTVAASAGFEAHGHRDMEIISYVLEGALRHQDSTGKTSVLKAGEIQRMTAGSGIVHSEFNQSPEAQVHFLQIWIHPNERGLEPGYQQRQVPQQGPLTAIVSPDARGNSLKIHQDVVISRLQLQPGESITLPVGSRAGYLHMIEGSAAVNVVDQPLGPGDAVGIMAATGLTLSATADTHLTALWFDLPAFHRPA